MSRVASDCVNLYLSPLDWMGVITKFIFNSKKVEFIRDFESAVASLVKKEFVLTTGSARASFFLALEFLKNKYPDKNEVILSSYNFFAMAEVIKALGLVPIFSDIEKDTFNISNKEIKTLISDKTLCVLMTNSYGSLCDYADIISFLDERFIPIIEDAAHSLGIITEDSANIWASFSSLSLTKPISGFCGGVLLTNDSELNTFARERIVYFKERSFGDNLKVLIKGIVSNIATSPFIFNLITVYIWRFLVLNKTQVIDAIVTEKPTPVDIKAIEYKLPPFFALVALKNLKSFSQNMKRQKRNSEILDQVFDELGIKHQRVKVSSHLNYVIRVDDIKKTRFDLIRLGIDTRAGYLISYNDLPNAKLIEREALFIPNHNKISEARMMSVAFKLKNYFKEGLKP